MKEYHYGLTASLYRLADVRYGVSKFSFLSNICISNSCIMYKCIFMELEKYVSEKQQIKLSARALF